MSQAGFSGSNEDAKYEPPEGEILVFAGQDNESVGANNRFRDGYADHLPVPAGITHYIGLQDLSYGRPIPGLNVEATWGAGPMCLKYYLESDTLKHSIIHLSISMVDAEEKVAKGGFDPQIQEIADFMRTYSDRPFILRIGYEFDGEWNRYDSTAFKAAFRHVVDRLRAQKLTNFATCMASSSFAVSIAAWEAYYPGDDYVDWLGYSYWEGDPVDCPTIDFADQREKPVFVAEITPRGYFLKEEDGDSLWNGWFTTFFEHIEKYASSIKAISYINCNWDIQPMWDDWGDTRLQINPIILKHWESKMAEPRFLNATDSVFYRIGFKE